MDKIIDISKPHIFGDSKKVVAIIYDHNELIGFESTDGNDLDKLLVFSSERVEAQPAILSDDGKEITPAMPAHNVAFFIPYATYLSTLKAAIFQTMKNYKAKIDFEPIEIDPSEQLYALYLQRVSELSA